MKLEFSAGTIELTLAPGETLPEQARSFFTLDARTKTLRGRACDYGPAVLALREAGARLNDCARAFDPLDDLILAEPIVPRPHQLTAFQQWRDSGYRGIAALPTGSGKTILAVWAIQALKRPALVLVPTIDLLTQWCGILEKFFHRPVGMLGGGSHTVEELTVSTYDSALLQMEFIGNRFAFLIADECHHLPAPETRLGASMCIAPYRLGLSATPELPPDREETLYDLIGPVVCQIHIDELEGKVLSPYVVKHLEIPLEPEELRIYQEERSIYLNFVRSNRIDFRQETGWSRFLALAGRSPEGKRAFAAFLHQRKLARGGEAKFRALRELMQHHAGERIIIFTADNPTAYEIGRRFLLPVLTHLTKAAERKEFLACFRSGEYPVLVTNRVLNEGVDVPDAAVGIVLSGTASVREHVQRLGRVLRPAAGKKQATLYELVSAGTSEESVSSRRREHRAYWKH